MSESFSHIAQNLPSPYGLCEQLRINISSFASEETYNPFQAVQDIYVGFRSLFACWKNYDGSYGPSSFFNDLYQIGSFSINDVYVIALMTLSWTVVRFFFEGFICKPFAKIWKMNKNSAEKFPESAFKAVAYFILWFSAVHVTFFRSHDFFNKTLSLWHDCKFKFSLPPADLCFVYGLEASFYFHSIYATLFLDSWRRDSIAMLLHHFITLTLIGFAYTVRYLKIGILIFVLNDISDVLLELGKCFVYMKVRGSRFAFLWNHLSTLSSSMFAVSWLVFRNLFHLTKVWRSAAYGTFISAPYLPTPFHLFFNFLLGILYLFYLYWWYFIMVFVFRILTGRMKEVEDIRDHEVESEFTEKKDLPHGYVRYRKNRSQEKKAD